MLETLEMDADDVGGQFWFLGRRCHRTHRTWINGWLDSQVSRMYHFTYKVAPPDLSGLLISLRPNTFSRGTWKPEYTRSNLTSTGIEKSTTAKLGPLRGFVCEQWRLLANHDCRMHYLNRRALSRCNFLNNLERTLNDIMLLILRKILCPSSKSIHTFSFQQAPHSTGTHA
jgi:hypothetical protein